MGLPLSNLKILCDEALPLLSSRQSMLSLGVPDMPYGWAEVGRVAGVDIPNADIGFRALFSALGFSQIRAMDISDYEGADIHLDLNKPVPPEYENAFDLILDPGTVEHVFDAFQAFENIVAMLKVGGVVVHHNPISGWIDHGFYQFSPCLFHDVYRDNGFDNIGTWVAKMDPAGRGDTDAVPYPYLPMSTKQLGPKEKWVQYNVARKTEEVVFRAPQQTRYTKREGWK